MCMITLITIISIIMAVGMAVIVILALRQRVPPYSGYFNPFSVAPFAHQKGLIKSNNKRLSMNPN